MRIWDHNTNNYSGTYSRHLQISKGLYLVPACNQAPYRTHTGHCLSSPNRAHMARVHLCIRIYIDLYLSLSLYIYITPAHVRTSYFCVFMYTCMSGIPHGPLLTRLHRDARPLGLVSRPNIQALIRTSSFWSVFNVYCRKARLGPCDHNRGDYVGAPDNIPESIFLQFGGSIKSGWETLHAYHTWAWLPF